MNKKKNDRHQDIMLRDHFLYFQNCVNMFQRMFGLSSVDIGCRVSESNKKGTCCETQEESRWGNFRICVYRDWLLDEKHNNDKEIKRVALHEIMEIVLWELRTALSEKQNSEKTDTLIHKVINTIVNTIEPN